MNEHVMVDLETLGLGSRAIVVSIGAVRFNIETGKEIGRFYRTLSVYEQEKVGRTMEAKTVLWWMYQSDAARNALMTKPAYVVDALADFARFLGAAEGLWGNGVVADNLWLGTLYDDFGLRRPWTYKQDRCFRTMKEMFPVDMEPMQTTEHHALDDAVYQYKWLMKIMEKIKNAASN